MARRISRATVQGSNSDATVSSGVPTNTSESGDVVLRLLHTADWHLGRRFPSFPEETQKKLSRAHGCHHHDSQCCSSQGGGRRALRRRPFDDPTPSEFLGGTRQDVRDRTGRIPVFLVPAPRSAHVRVRGRRGTFARVFPDGSTSDRDDFTHELTPDVMRTHAVPIRRRERSGDSAPPRETETHGSASGASTAPRSTEATRRTFRLVGTRVFSVDSTIWR